ncbi:hypothetical protein [Thioclava indica]|uniref:Uncharacterized protein n=1 Tax=Thioclava indica TaxID=1353528 RepID=A0A074K797_9RHOB|nr:hypothetical protein [Thioclava indica]KEO57442.1 hypothetical protein DT23_05065 [Thioclava indica]
MEWLKELDPRVLQGSLTVLAAVIASGTALWIAYVAYPRQKRFDRVNDWNRDKRESYGQFLSHLEDFLLEREIREGADKKAQFRRLTGVLGQLEILGEREVFDLACLLVRRVSLEVKHNTGIVTRRSVVKRDDVWEMREKLVAAMKRDLAK